MHHLHCLSMCVVRSWLLCVLRWDTSCVWGFISYTPQGSRTVQNSTVSSGRAVSSVRLADLIRAGCCCIQVCPKGFHVCWQLHASCCHLAILGSTATVAGEPTSGLLLPLHAAHSRLVQRRLWHGARCWLQHMVLSAIKVVLNRSKQVQHSC